MDIFLTPQSKEYYLNEFKKAKACTDEYWDVDNGLIDVLDSINQNSNVQTLLSKRSDDLEVDNVSYLHFTHTESVTHKILPMLKHISNELKKIKCTHSVNYYTADIYNSDIVFDTSIKLDVVANVKKYTNINCCIIEFVSFYETDHAFFWDLLKDSLKDLVVT
jgi:hypothetical protein